MLHHHEAECRAQSRADTPTLTGFGKKKKGKHKTGVTAPGIVHLLHCGMKFISSSLMQGVGDVEVSCPRQQMDGR